MDRNTPKILNSSELKLNIDADRFAIRNNEYFDDLNAYTKEFSIQYTNTSNNNINYEIRLENDSNELKNYTYIYLLDSSNGNVLIKPVLLKDFNGTLYKDVINGGELTYNKEFKLKIWNIKNEVVDESINFKVILEG